VQRRTIAKIVVLLAIFGFFIAFVGVSNIAYAVTYNAEVDVAIGQLTRAESAQTPNEVIHHVTVAKAILPETGSVFWWSPEKANFESIQAELDDIISRAKSISSLDEGNEQFNSEMWNMHARLKVIQETLVAF
jgi:hypothetical protein